MSFQVGDKVVAKSGDDRVFDFRTHILFKRIFLTLNDQHYAYPYCWFRHATPEEIAAGHRIDTPQLEVLEMIDVSPNCGVSEL